jgi:hypothetical protein
MPQARCLALRQCKPRRKQRFGHKHRRSGAGASTVFWSAATDLGVYRKLRQVMCVLEPDPKAYAACSLAAERPLSKPITAARFWRRERVFMPQTCRSQYPSGPAQLGGFRSFADTRTNAKQWPIPDVSALVVEREGRSPREGESPT